MEESGEGDGEMETGSNGGNNGAGQGNVEEGDWMNINVAVPGEVVAMVLVDWLELREQLVAWQVCRLWHRLLDPHFQRHVRAGNI
jgi:hypothetical protein